MAHHRQNRQSRSKNRLLDPQEGRARYRAAVGQGEVWRSLKTRDRRTANLRIAVVSAELEQDWARLAAEAKRGPGSGTGGAGLTHQHFFAIQREIHIKLRDAHIAEPGTGVAALRWESLAQDPVDAGDEAALDCRAREVLTSENGTPPTDAQVEKFKTLLLDPSHLPPLRSLPEVHASPSDGG